MALQSFNKADITAIREALDIAEDKIGGFYKFSFDQWKRHRYEVKTLLTLSDHEITTQAFALLNKYSWGTNCFESMTKKKDFYFICLQDHQIIKALQRDKHLGLLPLLIYIFTHELIHIVRFCNFYQRFEITGKDREEEEAIVHETTFSVLKDLSLPKMDYVLESYEDHRICDLGII